MEIRSFHIKDLNIHKIAGFPRGLPPYEGLSPQINIIAGPNASGKSTTAKAIQKVIWRNQTEGLQIDGNVNIGNEPWAIRVDSNQIKVQRNGKEDELTGLPAVEEQGSYLLALHELVSIKEENLAQHIINESIGGFDLDKAREDLGYSDNVKHRNARECNDYDKANRQVKEQRENQEKLKREQERLSGLYEEKEKAEGASKLKELYSKVVDYLEAKLSYEQKKEQFDKFPEVLEKATGEEYETIGKLEDNISKAQNSIDEAKDKIDENKETLDQLGIPQDGISNQDLVELEERAENLQEWKEQIDEIESEKVKNESLQQEVLKSLGENVDPSRWDGLELQEVGELEKFLQTAHSTASAKRFFEKEIEELEKQKTETEYESKILQKGIDALSQWLLESRSSSGIPNWIVPSVLIIAVLAILGSLVRWEAGLIGLIIILALTAYGFFKTKQNTVNQNVKVREEDYRKTELTPPDNWDADSVRQRLETLIRNLQDAEWHERIFREIDKREEQIESLQKQIKQVEETGDELLEKLTALPEFPFEDPQNYNSLYWFIVHAQKWQKAHEEVKSLEKKLKAHKENFNSELKKFNDLCNKYNAERAEDATETKAIFKDLSKQEGTRQEAAKEIKAQKRDIEEKNEAIDGWNNELKQIYQKLDIEFGNKDEVRDLLDQLDEFKTLKQEHHAANVLFSDKKIAMENHSKFKEEQSHVEELSLDQANDKLNAFEETASGLEEINKTITEIERDIANVEGGNSLENALKDRDEALLNLKNLYDENLTSITGDLLVNQLKKELREQNRPRVFKKANRLFNRITKGRNNLDVDEKDTKDTKDTPEFIAYDNVEKEGKTLNQLSTGTRIQLLFSVRMAFVETQESAIKLPILADELLANSDDVRANAIIEALTEISKDGRQVFYFTAQADEVWKWKSYLSNSEDIDFKIVQLPGDRISDEIEYDAQPSEPVELLQKIPKPEGMDYEEYGDVINGTQYNLMGNKPSELHLWYVMDDEELLYNCLKQGLNRWGQLESFWEHGGKIEGLQDETISISKEKIRLLEHYQDLIQQGSPIFIDRSVLENSDAISDKFIDEVSQKLNELEGNPEPLLDALKNSEISGFRTNKIDELESYFIEKGFIDERERLSVDEIQSQTKAFVSRHKISAEEAEEFLRRIIDAN
jgi:DNA repair exonuclease SbcCD ATPase subunit